MAFADMPSDIKVDMLQWLPVTEGLQYIGAARFADDFETTMEELKKTSQIREEIRTGLHPAMNKLLHLPGMDYRPAHTELDFASCHEIGELDYLSFEGMDYVWDIDMDEVVDIMEWVHECCIDPEATDWFTSLPSLNESDHESVQQIQDFLMTCSNFWVWWLPVNMSRDVNQIILAFEYKTVQGSCRFTDVFDEPAGFWATGFSDSP